MTTVGILTFSITIKEFLTNKETLDAHNVSSLSLVASSIIVIPSGIMPTNFLLGA